MSLYSNQLKIIRQYLKSQVGDLILSTAGTPVSSTTYVDTSLRKGADYYNNHGYRGYCYSGSAIGQERDVSDFATVGSVTFAPAFSPALVAEDLFELSRIFTADECKKAINMAIEHIAEQYLIDVKDSTAITLVADTYEYSLPASFVSVHRIITEDSVDSGTFEKEDVIDFRDWDLIPSYKLKLDENQYSISAGKDLQIEAKARQATVDADTDVIYLPPSWIIQKAITFLPMAKIQSNALENTYKSALQLSAKEPRNWPEPLSRRVVE